MVYNLLSIVENGITLPTFHKVTRIKWNVKHWADLAIQRAAEEWNE